MYKEDEEALFLELARSVFEDDEEEEESCTAGEDATCFLSYDTTLEDSSSEDDSEKGQDFCQGDNRSRVRFGSVTIREFSSSSAPELIQFPSCSGSNGALIEGDCARNKTMLLNMQRSSTSNQDSGVQSIS
jgi:hypothetical protein